MQEFGSNFQKRQSLASKRLANTILEEDASHSDFDGHEI